MVWLAWYARMLRCCLSAMVFVGAGCGHLRREVQPNPTALSSNVKPDNAKVPAGLETLDAAYSPFLSAAKDEPARATPVAARETAGIPSTEPNATALPQEGGSLLPGTEPTPLRAVNPWVWGIVDARGYPRADQIAPNGYEYTPIFSLDMHFNFWLWRRQRLYSFTDLTFWAQKAAPGVTNSTQGSFDFSKREFDFSTGLAWNYSGRWEARAFAYSFNNLNRGQSGTLPAGYNDGVALENRYYLSDMYDALGTPDFDLARATFVSVGYYPSKDMVDSNGNTFKPGLFAHAYLTLDLWGERCYLYADTILIDRNTLIPKLLDLDFGIAFRPFADARRWEFRLGSADMFDLQYKQTETSLYGAVRLIF